MPRSTTTVWAVSVLLLAGIASPRDTYGQTITAEVEGGRPLAAAVDLLERVYSRPISYEDPMTVNAGELKDDIENFQRTPDPSHRIFVQKGRKITFQYKTPTSLPSWSGDPQQFKAETDKALTDALNSMLDGYATAGGPESFAVTSENGSAYVLPISFLAKEGKIQPTMAILDTKITIPPGTRTRIDLYMDICAALSKTTGTKVGASWFPVNGGSMQARSPTTISGTDIPARTLLDQLLTEFEAEVWGNVPLSWPDGTTRLSHEVIIPSSAGSLSWRVLYGPGWGYFINFHPVSRPEE